MREAAEVRQLDHLTRTVREPLERPPHGERLLAAGGLDIGALGRLLALLDPLGARAPTLVHEVAAKGVDPAVVDDPEDPCAHASALAPVPQPAAPDREERLLRDVLGAGAVADHAVGEREGRSAVAVVDRLEGAGVAGRHEVHQFLVGQAIYLKASTGHSARESSVTVRTGRRTGSPRRRGPAG